MKSLIDLYCGSAAIKDGETLLSANRQRRYERGSDAAGRTVLSAKYSDQFNFVDLARVVISADGTAIDSASCSCPRFNDEKGLCCHCAALLLKYEEADEQKLMRAAVDFDLEAEPAKDGEEAPTEGVASPEPALAAAGAIAGGENVHGIRDFSFRFGNNEKDLYPDELHPELSRESFELIFGKTRKAEKLYANYKKWNGICYGIAAASGMFVAPNDPAVTDFRADAKRPFDLRLSDRSDKFGLALRTFIETMFVSQMNDYIGAYRWFLSNLPQSKVLGDLIASVEDFEKSGENPVILELSPSVESNSGHAVFPYRHERLNETESRLHIYDSNYPDEVRYIDLEQDEKGNYISWRFNMQKDVDFTSETGSVLDYVPHEIYQIPWDERASHTDKKPKALFSTPCADLTVQDEDGKDVLKIAAGCIQPLRGDVIPIRVNGAEAAMDRYDCWIDQGAYRVINDDPERELAFELTGDDLGLEVKTEAKEADALIDEENRALKIKMVENKPWYVKVLDTAKDFVIRAGASILSGIALDLLRGRLFMSNIKPEEISEFTIDGEPVNVRDHVTFENEQPEAVENWTESGTYEETVDEEALYIANKKLDPEP